MYGKNSIAILVLTRLPTTFPWEVRTEMVILGCLPHSHTLYRHAREKLDRHFGLNTTPNNLPIGSPYRNSGFRLSATLTYAV